MGRSTWPGCGGRWRGGRYRGTPPGTKNRCPAPRHDVGKATKRELTLKARRERAGLNGKLSSAASRAAARPVSCPRRRTCLGAACSPPPPDDPEDFHKGLATGESRFERRMGDPVRWSSSNPRQSFRAFPGLPLCQVPRRRRWGPTMCDPAATARAFCSEGAVSSSRRPLAAMLESVTNHLLWLASACRYQKWFG